MTSSGIRTTRLKFVCCRLYVMKLLINNVFARRKFLICVVMLFACFLINYEVISNFLQARKQNGDNAVSMGIARGSYLDPTFYIDDGNELNKNTTTTSASNVEQVLFTEYNNNGSQNKVINVDRYINKIASNILETIDPNLANGTEQNYTTCNSTIVIGNSCEIGSCLQLQLPNDLRTRVEQLVAPAHLRINDSLRNILTIMADKVPGYYDLILISGVSFSHFEEAQAMLYNVHTYLFPQLTNFTFIFYNLGLSVQQRAFIAKICKCHLIDFPFHFFPQFVNFLKCYTWKPLIVNAHISRSNLLFWIDVSVRFKKQSLKIKELLNKARLRGIQVLKGKHTIAQVTLPSLFHFFGDEACVYADHYVILSGLVLYKNAYFVKSAILEPWAACAMSTNCMCPRNKNLRRIRITCHHYKGPYYYGICHRFDQSALSLILTKIYKDQIRNIFAPMKDYLEIKRSDKMTYPVERAEVQQH